MLILSRKSQEQIVIGEDIVLTVVAVKGGRVSIGIEAPESVRIQRSELLPAEPSCVDPAGPIQACSHSIGSELVQACAPSTN